MHGRNERDTCREFVIPRLEASGWSDRFRTEYAIRRDRSLSGESADRQIEGGRADYVLEAVPGLIVGVVEAKREYSSPGQGVQQAIEYATALDVPTAIASDGHAIVERDLATGTERDLDAFPTPAELWDRYVRHHGLSDDAADALRQPFDRTLRNADGSVQEPRYYQVVAIHRVLRAIATGDRRVLLLMATGAGKTFTALQLVSKLLGFWKAEEPSRNRRILYLADRDALIKQPLQSCFRPVFGDGATRIQGRPVMGREIYFATYQALHSGEEQSLLDDYPADFFDLVIVDECHRGSASEESTWRAILDRFTSAIHLGLTATPKRDDPIDTYDYFGEPVYEYSLRQGIEDGYLAPYRVRRVVLDVDAEGWLPTPEERDLFGRVIDDGTYTTRDFERTLSLRARTRAAARHLSRLLATDPTARTIVFCVDSEHAEHFRREMVGRNRERVRADPSWVVRIVSDEGKPGRRLLERMCDAESTSPVVATTSRMLSTGVDIEDLKWVVLFRPVGSMVEFKQIIGRGTRLYPDKDKYFFDIVDFVGATSHFADPGFDGAPIATVTTHLDPEGDEQETDDDAASSDGDLLVREPIPSFEPGGAGEISRDPRRRKFYVDGDEVQIVAEGFLVPDTSTGRLRLVEYRDYVAEQVRRLCPSVDDLRSRWSSQDARAMIESLLAERGITVTELAEKSGLSPETDSFDVLAHVAWDMPQRTRAERARLARAGHVSELERLTPEARSVIEALLDRYEREGVDEMTHPYVLEVPPLSEIGSPAQISQLFGGAEGWHRIVDDVQTWLYSA